MTIKLPLSLEAERDSIGYEYRLLAAREVLVVVRSEVRLSNAEALGALLKGLR